MNKWISRSEIIKEPKYQKGACENCGSVAHQKKQCLERPRKIQAKYTNTKIVTENEILLVNEKTTRKANFLEKQPAYTNKYDESRDHWGVQDIQKYDQVVEEYNFEQEVKKQAGIDDTNEEYMDELKIEDTNLNMDTRARTSHSFRDRDQIPRYLADFVKDHDKDKKIEFNDTYMKYTGDSLKFLEQERFVLDNDQANSVALPTATEMMFKKEVNKKTNRDIEVKTAIENLYGKVESFQERAEEMVERGLINTVDQGYSDEESSNEEDKIGRDTKGVVDGNDGRTKRIRKNK